MVEIHHSSFASLCSPISSDLSGLLPQLFSGHDLFDDTYAVSEADYNLIDNLSEEEKLGLLPILRLAFPSFQQTLQPPPSYTHPVHDSWSRKRTLQNKTACIPRAQAEPEQQLGERSEDEQHQPMQDGPYIMNQHLMPSNSNPLYQFEPVAFSRIVSQYPVLASSENAHSADSFSPSMPQYPVLASSDNVILSLPCKHDSWKSLHVVEGGLDERQQAPCCPGNDCLKRHHERDSACQFLALEQRNAPCCQASVKHCQQTLDNVVASNRLTQIVLPDKQDLQAIPDIDGVSVPLLSMHSLVPIPTMVKTTDLSCQTEELTQDVLHNNSLHMGGSEDGEGKNLSNEDSKANAVVCVKIDGPNFCKGLPCLSIEDVKRSEAGESTITDVKVSGMGLANCFSSPISSYGSKAAWNHVQTPPKYKLIHLLYEKQELYGSPPSLNSGGNQDIHITKCTKNDVGNHQSLFLEHEEGNVTCASNGSNHFGRVDSQSVSSMALVNAFPVRFPEGCCRKRMVVRKMVGWLRKRRSSHLSKRTSHRRQCQLPCCTQNDSSIKRRRLSASLQVITKSPMSCNPSNCSERYGMKESTNSCHADAQSDVEDISMDIGKSNEPQKLGFVAGRKASGFGHCQKMDSKFSHCTNQAKLGSAYCEHHLMQQDKLRKYYRETLVADVVHLNHDTKVTAHHVEQGVTEHVRNKRISKAVGSGRQEVGGCPMVPRARRSRAESAHKLDGHFRRLEGDEMSNQVDPAQSEAGVNWLGVDFSSSNMTGDSVLAAIRGVDKRQDILSPYKMKADPTSAGSEMHQKGSEQVERCHKRDGRQWHCSERCVPGSNYCRRHGSSRYRRKI